MAGDNQYCLASSCWQLVNGMRIMSCSYFVYELGHFSFAVEKLACIYFFAKPHKCHRRSLE